MYLSIKICATQTQILYFPWGQLCGKYSGSDKHDHGGILPFHCVGEVPPSPTHTHAQGVLV